MEAQKLHRRLRDAEDGLYDWLTDHAPSKVLDVLWEGIEPAFDAAHRAVCSVTGHDVDDDQCGIPEHRFCYRCNRAFPNGLVDQRLTDHWRVPRRHR